MTSREELLSAYGRYLELEQLLPDWQQQLQDKNEALQEAKEELNWQKLQLMGTENPNFFQRLLGNWEAKIEKAQEEVRAASAEYEQQKWDIAQLEATISEAQQEFDRLALDTQRYQQMLPLNAQEARYLAPAAIVAASRCLAALEAASPWVRRDARTTRVSSGNRRMELLAQAQSHAGTLMRLLSLLPEGTIVPGRYLRDPDNYIRGVTSEYAQLDRLNYAMDQVRDHRRSWRAML